MTTSGYTLLDIPRPRQGLVHVHAGSDELGRVYQADLPINASQRAFLEAVAAMEPVDSSAWSTYTPQAHREYEQLLTPPATPGPGHMAHTARRREPNPPEDAHG